jgi:general secretion pathway protein G
MSKTFRILFCAGVALIFIIFILPSWSTLKKRFSKHEVTAAKEKMRVDTVGLDKYWSACGRYPSTQEGLVALTRRPNEMNCKNPSAFEVIGAVPVDYWKNPYVYKSEGTEMIIISLGKDGKKGGEGDEQDFSTDDL